MAERVNMAESEYGGELIWRRVNIAERGNMAENAYGGECIWRRVNGERDNRVEGDMEVADDV